jgi:hypothetical protein
VAASLGGTKVTAPFCNRCFEEFPLASAEDGKKPIRMGLLYKLTRFGKKIRDAQERDDDNNFLCGNCYFDLTD